MAKKHKFSTEQTHIIELLENNSNYFIRESIYFRFQEVTDGEYQGFKYYFNLATLNVFKRLGLLEPLKDLKYKLKTNEANN